MLDHVQDLHTELLGLGVAVGGQGGRGTALGLGRGVWHHGVDVGCRPVTVLYDLVSDVMRFNVELIIQIC